MRLLIVAVGQRVPDWAQTAWDDYAKRFPRELQVELKAVKTEPRASKSLCLGCLVQGLSPSTQAGVRARLHSDLLGLPDQ